ncbi:C39 family peptidase [Effusibacillus pohliae]|uniref:C39 family peptidase n=1 Tax=Effusibacillus pohliae TaxID=232270 RepID=UPI000364D511|nr:C39 family peptidase [Effusibacillus pohliae]
MKKRWFASFLVVSAAVSGVVYADHIREVIHEQAVAETPAAPDQQPDSRNREVPAAQDTLKKPASDANGQIQPESVKQTPTESPDHPPQQNGAAPKPQAASKVEIQVPGQSQEPEYYNGCEVTSVSMLLTAAGHPMDKTELADRIAKDSTPQVVDENGAIISWGDPNVGFVGDITGQQPGYGVYHGPVAKMLNSILPNGAEDLTGRPFDEILGRVAAGKPVIVWTTVDFQPTSGWVKWQGPNGPVKATFDEHAVLLVGYDDQHVFVNDPLDGSAGKAVDRNSFTTAWEQLGKQAVTFKGGV